MKERNEEALTNVTPRLLSAVVAILALCSRNARGFDTLTIEMPGMLLATERAKNLDVVGLEFPFSIVPSPENPAGFANFGEDRPVTLFGCAHALRAPFLNVSHDRSRNPRVAVLPTTNLKRLRATG